MTRKEIIDKALSIITGEREEQYGKPENNFALIASFWETYLKAKCVGSGAGVCIVSEDVALMMQLLKIARIASGQTKDDNYIDAIGYAALAGEIATE